jgi:hypothetical protein
VNLASVTLIPIKPQKNVIMKYLQIECFDAEGIKFETIKALKLDATQQMTIISTSKSNKEYDTIRWPQNILNWIVIPGMVSIYYKNGCYIEITRVNG